MSLPAGQRRALNLIEKTLADDHPGPGPLFAIFTSLAGHEAMPLTERVTARRQRRMRVWVRVRPGIATAVGLAMAMGALLALSLMLPGPQARPGHGHPRLSAPAVSPGRAPARLRYPARQARHDKPGRGLRALSKDGRQLPQPHPPPAAPRPTRRPWPRWRPGAGR